MPDRDAFAQTYDRLAQTRLAAGSATDSLSTDAPPSARIAAAKPRSRLLERLALLQPQRAKSLPH